MSFRMLPNNPLNLFHFPSNCFYFCSDLTFANQVLHDFRVEKEEPD
jgi:hypothetical protein